MNEQDGQLELPLDLAQIGEQRGDLRSVVFIDAVQPDERIQDQEDGALLLNGVGDLRNRAMLLLLAVYGLRFGEVTTLGVGDLDWVRRVMRVRRIKTNQLQEYPLTPATGQAIRHYLKKGRPPSARPELFLTLRAPFRPLSSGAVYEVTSTLFARLDVASPKRGAHSLRHACATHLLNSGFTLKAIGDHLRHRSLSATQVYAKVDLVGLRRVAAFDLGGLL